MERSPDTSRRNLHKLLFTDPLSENLAEIWRHPLPTARDVEVMTLEDPNPMTRSAQYVCDCKTTNTCDSDKGW